TIGNIPTGVALINRSHGRFEAEGTSRRGRTSTVLAPFTAAHAALAAPPAPRITTVLSPGSNPTDANAALTPWTSVLSPIHFPLLHATVFTAPISRASGVSSCRKGMTAILCGIVTEKP